MAERIPSNALPNETHSTFFHLLPDKHPRLLEPGFDRGVIPSTSGWYAEPAAMDELTQLGAKHRTDKVAHGFCGGGQFFDRDRDRRLVAAVLTKRGSTS